MNQLKEIFIENFESALQSMGIDDPKEEKYVIVPNTEDEKYTTMDDIYRIWVTPAISGIRLSYDSIIDNLVKEQKKVAPLWIKIHKEKEKPVILYSSQRYRKMRDILLRRRDNQFPPFEISEEVLFEFSESQERLEAIRILFFTRKSNAILKQFIGTGITFQEVKDNFQHHFEKYRFYPPNYNRFKKGEDSYSSLVLEKDFENSKFSVFRNPNTENKIEYNLDFEEAIKYYIKQELNNEIYGIKLRMPDTQNR